MLKKQQKYLVLITLFLILRRFLVTLNFFQMEIEELNSLLDSIEEDLATSPIYSGDAPSKNYVEQSSTSPGEPIQLSVALKKKKKFGG